MNPIEAQDALERLEEMVHRLKIDFDRFFNGALPTPPDSLRFKTFAEMRKLRSVHHKSAAVRFRVNSLEAKLNSLNELFNRRLREFESSDIRRPGVSTAPRQVKQRDPYDGIVIKQEPDPRAVEALYSELYGKNKRGKKTDLESFRGFLLSQAEAIRDKTGCEKVIFRVTSQKGKLKLKAKAVEDPAG